VSLKLCVAVAIDLVDVDDIVDSRATDRPQNAR
jgi:hypothetical protein